ncbi:hypothetical protein SLEP1_g11433 [Rubroshorea leprosula]|uniref:Methyltransferase n=1 Tax=Rubroshorea leprosula TaxID=152421 RepID=A0AAV5IBA3_9ROSI|nr:hypothetical protein SLEP1_g11433 [Rubroshorea leprosula]
MQMSLGHVFRNVPLQACMHRVPVDSSEPPGGFVADYKHWKDVVAKSYLSGVGINWSSIRNVMDMRAVYGGFAAALKDLKVWVMNVVQ